MSPRSPESSEAMAMRVSGRILQHLGQVMEEYGSLGYGFLMGPGTPESFPSILHVGQASAEAVPDGIPRQVVVTLVDLAKYEETVAYVSVMGRGLSAQHSMYQVQPDKVTHDATDKELSTADAIWLSNLLEDTDFSDPSLTEEMAYRMRSGLYRDRDWRAPHFDRIPFSLSAAESLNNS